MITIELLWDDLSKQGKQKFRNEGIYPDNMNWDVIPLAILEFDEAEVEIMAPDLLDDERVQMLWNQFADVPLTSNDLTNKAFHVFPRFTPKEYIWHWFDEHYSLGLKSLLYPPPERKSKL